MSALSLPASSSVLRCARRRVLLATSLLPSCQQVRFFSRSAVLKASDPLRIMFFSTGDGIFSNPSLQLLHKEMLENPSLISSIDVITSPPKRVGRGHKELRRSGPDVEAERLGLPVHLIGGFDYDEAESRNSASRWQPDFIRRGNFQLGDKYRRLLVENLGQDDAPKLTLSLLEEKEINLLIAVSYGRFIPAHFIRAVKYGGLNLHPSLLPDLRGAAPIQWAIARNRPFTGVTLQTLDELEFDRGLVLAQTPGVEIGPRESTPSLQDRLRGPAAALLLDGLRAGLHDEATRRSLQTSLPLILPSPAEPTATTTTTTTTNTTSRDDGDPQVATATSTFAPKIRPETLEMRWDRLATGAWRPEDADRRVRAFGPLRTRLLVHAKKAPRGWHKALQPTVAQRQQQKSQQLQDVKFETIQAQVCDVSPVALEWLPQAISTRILGLCAQVPEALLRGSALGPPLPEPHVPAVPAAADIIGTISSDDTMSRDNRNDSRSRTHDQPPRILVAEVVDKATGTTDRIGLLCVADADGKGALVILHELLVPAMKELLGHNSSNSNNNKSSGDDQSSQPPPPPPPMASELYRNACVRIRTLHVAGQRPRPAWYVLSQCDFSRVHEPGRMEYR